MQPFARRGIIPPDLFVIACGVVVAMQVGKLPAALPVLRDAYGLSLVQSGFLLSLVQLASMVGGLALGLALRRAGLRRGLVVGLLLVVLASAAGPSSPGATALLAWRALEGLGVLLVALAAPSLLRELVPPERMSLRMGLWGAYMPTGMGLALLAAPPAMAIVGWSGWWWMLALLSLAMAVTAVRLLGLNDPPSAAGVPATLQDTYQATHQGTHKATHKITQAATHAASPQTTRHTTVSTDSVPAGSLLRRTLRAPAPWLLALGFGAYSSQWLSVVGFLPTIYAEAGVSAALAGPLTALAALVNIGGNVVGARALHRGRSPMQLLRIGYATMGLGALLAFGLPDTLGPTARFMAVLLFSAVGGLVPATLFALSARATPQSAAMPYVIGLMTQGTGFGQVLGPPAVAWWAALHGGWSLTWMGTGLFALIGLVLTVPLAATMARAATSARP
jgi:cyanate permease